MLIFLGQICICAIQIAFCISENFPVASFGTFLTHRLTSSSPSPSLSSWDIHRSHQRLLLRDSNNQDNGNISKMPSKMNVTPMMLRMDGVGFDNSGLGGKVKSTLKGAHKAANLFLHWSCRPGTGCSHGRRASSASSPSVASCCPEGSPQEHSLLAPSPAWQTSPGWSSSGSVFSWSPPDLIWFDLILKI